MVARNGSKIRKVKRKTNGRKIKKVTKPKAVKKMFAIVCMDGKCRVYRVFETKNKRFVVVTKKGKKSVYCMKKGHPVYKTRAAAVRVAKKVITNPTSCKSAKKHKMTKQAAAKGRKTMKEFVDAGKGAAKKMPVAVKEAVSGRPTDTFKLPSLAELRKKITGSKFGAKKTTKRGNSKFVETIDTTFGLAKHEAKKYKIPLTKTVKGKRISKTENELWRAIIKKLESKKSSTWAERNAVKMAKAILKEITKKETKAAPKKKMTPAQRRRLKKALGVIASGVVGAAGKKIRDKRRKTKKNPIDEYSVSMPETSLFGRTRISHARRRPLNYGFGQFL